MEEHETEIAYWAGRLIGYEQAWEVAEEIVETIKKAQNQALRIHDVAGRSEQLKAFLLWLEKEGYNCDFEWDDTTIEDYLKSL